MAEIFKYRYPLLDLIQSAFIITDVHSNVLYANQCTKLLFGYSRKKIVGEPIRVFFLEDDLTYFLPNILYLTLYGEGFKGEALLRHENGNRIFVYISTASFKENGEVYLTFSFQEIQRLKKMERERLEMERWASLGRMVEEIAHQIRNPIVAIGGYTQRVLKAPSSTQKNEPYLNRIFLETKRLEKLIQKVEEYVLMPRPFYQKESVEGVVKEVLQRISKEAMEKGIPFHLESKDLQKNGFFFIDKDLVIKALSNVLENSLDAFPERPIREKRAAIMINLFNDGEKVVISVSDRGEGIPKKNLDHIFDPFFSTRFGRLGLGLSFVRRGMDEHGGAIQVKSRLHTWTTVILTFIKDRRRKIRRELISPEKRNGDGSIF